MKLTSYLYLAFVVVLYVVNYFYLKINVFPFTGMVLGILLVMVIIINVYVKLKNKGNKKGLHGDDFIFTPEVAKSLKKIDPSIQYESSIIGSFFLIVGMLIFCIYTIFFTPYALIMKIFIVFNSFFAMILMGSMLITSYQQFVSYKESIGMVEQYKALNPATTMSDIVSNYSFNESFNEMTKEKTNDAEMIEEMFKNTNQYNNPNERRDK